MLYINWSWLWKSVHKCSYIFKSKLNYKVRSCMQSLAISDTSSGIKNSTFSSLLHRPLFTKFNTHPSWAKLVSNHQTYHIPSYYHQREKRSADFGFWPCDPPYFNTVFSTLKVRESEWPGGLNLTNSSKANQPMWSSSWPNQPLRSNQLINCWGSHNTHENQTRYICLPRNLCKGY